MEIVWAILVMIPLVAIFVITYAMNKKTPVPPGCEDVGCEGCNITVCENRKEKVEEKK
jgi:hypothetical protein